MMLRKMTIIKRLRNNGGVMVILSMASFLPIVPSSSSIKTDKLEKGLWYVTVRCATTVNATEKYIDTTKKLGRFFVYSGNTDVLNGVPYNIVASW